MSAFDVSSIPEIESRVMKLCATGDEFRLWALLQRRTQVSHKSEGNWFPKFLTLGEWVKIKFFALLSLLNISSKLVDPASDHLLHSKIKPCMSKTKQVTSESAYGSLQKF